MDAEVIDSTRVEEVAALLYMSFSAGQYSPSWATAPHKANWRNAAEAVIELLEGR